uniref:Uncharacterized protein n=1 Tax=Rhizophora mucronata TaxID=61149 RepID=A0A2P2QEK6_RHIMU
MQDADYSCWDENQVGWVYGNTQ